MFSKTFKYTMFLRIYGWLRLPLLAFVSPKVIELTDDRSVIKIPLGYRTQNHLKVMYFGALAIGAELSIALKAVQEIQESKSRIDFIFKDFKAEFLKRADADVHFVCDQARGVKDLIEKAKTSPDRLEQTFRSYAYCPSKGSEPVAEFQVTLSVKNRAKK